MSYEDGLFRGIWGFAGTKKSYFIDWESITLIFSRQRNHHVRAIESACKVIRRYGASFFGESHRGRETGSWGAGTGACPLLGHGRLCDLRGWRCYQCNYHRSFVFRTGSHRLRLSASLMQVWSMAWCIWLFGIWIIGLRRIPALSWVALKIFILRLASQDENVVKVV